MIVWDIYKCQKIFHRTAQQLDLQMIHCSKFYILNPHYILVSGNKALLVRVNKQEDFVVIADNKEHIEEHKQESSPSITQLKKKGPKFASYLLHYLIHQQHVYYLLISNTHKLIMVLQ